MAFHTTSHDLLWSSQIVPGVVSGKPKISSDDFYTFLVSNSNNKTVGHFVVVDNSDGSIVFSEKSNNIDRPITYAPLGIGRNVKRGNWNKGANNHNDMLVWGEMYIEDRGQEDPITGVTKFDGTLHYFQLPTNFQRNHTNDSISLATESGNMIMKTTLSEPAIPNHGRGAYFAFHAGKIRGWSKGEMCNLNIITLIQP